MNFIKNKFVISVFALLLVLAPIFVLAQDIDGNPVKTGSKIDNPLLSTDIAQFIQKLLENVIKLAVPAVALAVIYSGFLFVTAMGNPEKISAAKSALLYTVIGAAVLLGSWAIAKMISETVLKL